MSKDYLEKHKQQLAGTRGATKKSYAELFSDAESPELIREHARNKNQYIPDLDYGDPANFAKFGLAGKYYENAIKRIYNQYPYDGSLAEQLKFYNDLTPLEQHVFDNNYPKKTGYATFGANASTWDGTSTLVSGFGKTDTPEYILAYGGPHKENIYDTDVNQASNLEINWSNGATVEFWLKKDVFLNASTETQNECIFYIKNVVDERRLFIYTDSTAAGNLKVSYYNTVDSWAASVTQFAVSLDTGLTTIADGLWHHYAVVLTTVGPSADPDQYYKIELYVDGAFKSENFSNTNNEMHLTGSSIATIAAIGGGITTATDYLGYGKLSGSIDDFRFWKTARNAQEIGRHYFTNVAGGTNTDSAKYYYSSSIDSSLVDLGVYYKFNEGILGSTISSTSTIGDDFVLDYSGRVSNGTWTGYSSSSRSSNSAIVESGAATEEKGSPVVYSSHSDVQALMTDLENSGSQHDAANNASLYNSMPQWIRDEDNEAGETLSNLLQMVSSYLDTLYGQIGYINRLKEPYYASGSIKPVPHNKKLLASSGFDPPEIFLQSKVIEQILARDEKKLYEEKLHNIKNLIYKNIYNNLSYINKSKGTEKAFRNLFRCFGVDDDLFRLNLYGDNVEYELKDTYESVATKKKVIDFTGFNDKSGNRSAVVYQYPSSSSDYGFVSASSDLYIPFTAEAEIIFPTLLTSNHTGSADLELLITASLFGCHSSTASMDDTDALFGDPDRDFQVEAVKVDNGERVYFRLKSSNEWFDEIKTTTYPQAGTSSAKVYDNSKWNFAVRVRPENYPISSNVITSSGFYLDFYGINNYLGEVLDEFSLSGSISTDAAGDFITGSNKKFFIGAHRNDFTGSVLAKSDVRLSSLRVWHDYISDEEMQHHARDPNNFGRLNPGRTITTASAEAGLSSSIHIPQAEALALNWDFETTPTADSSGEFLIRDVSSGSWYPWGVLEGNPTSHSYGVYATHTKANHSAKGYGFTASKLPTNFEFIPTTRQLQPENLYSSDLVNILSTDDLFFTRESRPVKHFFSIEASMYEIISRRMLNFFASIIDFNNQIGEPINRYRGRYKGLEKLRHMFFDKIEEVSDIEKFVELYKWLDNALDTAVANLIPASANASKEVRSMVENHVLSRCKHQHRPPLFVDVPSPCSPGHTCAEEPAWIAVNEDYPDEIEDVDPGTNKLVTTYPPAKIPEPPKAKIEFRCIDDPGYPDGKCQFPDGFYYSADNVAKKADMPDMIGAQPYVYKHDQSLCKFKGCLDKAAKNYNTCATQHDQSKCEYDKGCTNQCGEAYDKKYSDYDPAVSIEKQCKFVYGCHDKAAINYCYQTADCKDEVALKKLKSLWASPYCYTQKDNSLCKYQGKTGCCDKTASNTCKKVNNWDGSEPLKNGECDKCDPTSCVYYGCKMLLTTEEMNKYDLEIMNPGLPQHVPCEKAGENKNYCCKITGCSYNVVWDKSEQAAKDCLNCSNKVTEDPDGCCHDWGKCKYKCCDDKTATNYESYGAQCEPGSAYNDEMCEYTRVCKVKSRAFPLVTGGMITLYSSNFGLITTGPNAGNKPNPGDVTIDDPSGCLYSACTLSAIQDKFAASEAAQYVLNMVKAGHQGIMDSYASCRFKCCLNSMDNKSYGKAHSEAFDFGWQCIQHSDRQCERCRVADDLVRTIVPPKISNWFPPLDALNCLNSDVPDSPVCKQCTSSKLNEPEDNCTAAFMPPCCDPKEPDLLGKCKKPVKANNIGRGGGGGGH